MKVQIAPTYVFDLDGTLVDTVPDIAAAINAAFAPYDCPAMSVVEAATMMGHGLGGFFWRSLVAKRLDLPAEEAVKVKAEFISFYRRSPVVLSKPYPGIPALLGEIRASGGRTAVCTNKVEDISEKILQLLDLRGMFDAVVGSGDDRPKKPDPLPLLEAISRAGGSRSRALMVGDSEADSGAAAAARIPIALVSHGYSAIPVRTLAANYYADSVYELRTIVKRFQTLE